MPAKRSCSAIYDCIWLACALLALHCPPADAQSLSVTGRVSDTTGAPLPGVSVQLRAPDARQRADTITDVAGKYRLEVGVSRRFELSFSLITFGRVTKTITGAAGHTVVDAVLPLAFTADVTVTGRRTFRNLEEAEDTHTRCYRARPASAFRSISELGTSDKSKHTSAS